jgi:diaminopimelate decarboxylase
VSQLLPEGQLQALAREHGTPLYITDLDRVVERSRELEGFDVVRFAQKANSGLALLSRLAREGLAVDAVSAGEIVRAVRAGFEPERIVFTSDLFMPESLELVARHGIHVNLGSADMIEQLAEVCPGAAVTLRINPGFGHGHAQQVNTGGATSKHGIWHEELGRTIARCQAADLVVHGLHVHIGSGSDGENLERVIGAMEGFLRDAPDTVTTISAGGGLPIPYRSTDEPFDVPRFVAAWSQAKQRWEAELGRQITLEVEPGRFLTAQAGVLLTEVRATKTTGEFDYVLVDAGFHTLLRPALYGAYHRVTALGHDGESTRPQVVAGPLCESTDVLTQDAQSHPTPQELPELAVGDLLCVHDVGAYGAAMASNYNSQTLPAEVVLEDGVPRLARRRQTIDELLDGES